MILAPTLTTWLVTRYGAVRVLLGGLLTAVAAYALFLPVAPDWTYAAMLPSMLLLGVSFSLAYGPLTMAATEGVDEGEHGLAGGLLYTAIQFGTALGISGVTAIGVAVTSGAFGLDAIRAALLLPVAAAVIAAVITAFGLRHRQAPTGSAFAGTTV
jgi:hypothetical protein